MFTRLIQFLFVLGAALPVPGYADAEDAGELSSLLKRVDRQTGDFRQMLIDPEGQTTQSSMGKFAIDQPGKFRWQTEAPFNQLLVSDGNTLWLYDPDLEQVTVKQVAPDDPSSPMSLLSGALDQLQDDYKVDQVSSEGERTVYRLTPLTSNDYFARVTLVFVAAQLREMLIQDLTGNINQIRFSGISQPDNLSTDLFSFQAPAGTDVIVDG